MKSRCSKAAGTRQVHYNPIYEELKTKAKVNLWSESNAQIYARRKNRGCECFWSHQGQ
ncbi:hypothetical protein JFU50_29115 [Peribacillus sp. TH14]|nr:hypothetical protein [Peribacillus sp. TH14]